MRYLLLLLFIGMSYGQPFQATFLEKVAVGGHPDYSLVHKFGQNPAVGSTFEAITTDGIYETPTPSNNVSIYAVSDDADDTIAGAGARQVLVQYLDSTFTLQEDTLDMNGTSQSTDSITNVIRILRAYVISHGTYNTTAAFGQQGTIDLELFDGTNWAQLLEVGTTGTGFGQSLIGCYTVPAGSTAYIISVTISLDGNQDADVALFKRESADDETSPFTSYRTQSYYAGITALHHIPHNTYESFPEKTDIIWMAKAATSSEVSVSFELLLKKN